MVGGALQYHVHYMTSNRDARDTTQLLRSKQIKSRLGWKLIFMMPQPSADPSSPTKRGFVSSIKSAFRRKSADARSQGTRTTELVNRLGRSHSFHEELAQSMPPNNGIPN